MKKIFLSLAFCTLVGALQSNAQILKRLRDKVKDKLETRAEDRTGDATDKVLDKAENSVKSSGNKSSSTDNSSSGNSPSSGSGTISKPPSIKTYKNYDFVPGDAIIFQSNLANEQIGEIPSQFTLDDGQLDVQTEDGINVVHVPTGAGATFSPRMKNTNYLPDQFTIEFDFKNEKFGLNHLKLKFGEGDGNIADLNLAYDYTNWGGSNNNPPDELHLNYDYPMQWHHIAIAVNKNQGKVYIDQNRVININNLTGNAKAIIFNVDGYENSFLKNIRVAAGGIDIYKKVTTDGKIVMHGILFNVDKSTLIPESMGSINQIFSLLKKDPSLKFEIDGHTDNTGNIAHNLTLSQQRAEAVKTQLISMGIDGSRLTTKGFGDTKPISDNNSPEGKANNRRVEFIKIQ